MKYNKKLAAGIAAALVLLSVFFLGGRSLAKKTAEVREMFYAGVDGDGLSLYNEIQKREACGWNLLTIASRYLDGDETEALETVLDTLADADGIREIQDADERLTEAAESFAQTLSRCDLSETDRRLMTEVLAQLNASAKIISHDGYNAKAAAMNDVLRQFPTGVIAFVNGIKTLELY